MADAERPIGWTALAEGTRVLSLEGEEIGRVAEVIGDEETNIFSGLVIRMGLLESDRFLPADQIAELTPEEVRLTISAAAAEKLRPYAE
ncbi:MAG: PRC-barrel domain-containing protein [Actinomycetota bacterium]